MPSPPQQNVLVTNVNPEAPLDFDEFVVTGGLWIDDELYTALDNTYPLNATFTSITGVLTFRAPGANKLEPRSAADVVAP